jgi:hypothetical protein
MSGYVEAVFEGHKEYIHGFLDGFLCAKGTGKGFYFNSDCGVKAETLSERLREIASLENKYHHVLLAKELWQALPTAEPCGIKAASVKAIKRGFFSFDIATASREEALAVKKVMDGKPAQVQLIDFKELQEIQDDAKGVELYTPVHEYQYEASGIFSGDIVELINLKKGLSDHNIVQSKDIHLEFVQE